MTPLRFGQALADAAARLERAGIADARRDARLLLAAAADCTVETVFGYPERLLDAAAQARFHRYVGRRQGGEPVSRICGKRAFWALSFALDEATLDPRPESETLVAAALAAFPVPAAPLRVLDLGTGSGCLLLAFLSELPQAEGLGVDISEAACRMARRNARTLGLAGRARFVCGDWAAAIRGRFDVVLCNPPYIEEAAIACLAPEVSLFDPRQALAGGEDGLACYRRLAAHLPRCLAPDGVAVVEIGAGQGDAVRDILSGDIEAAGSQRDLAGIERCLILRHRKTRSYGTEKIVGFRL